MNRITIPGLTIEEQGVFDELWKQLWDKEPRNHLRAQYYDGKNALRDMGIAMPPHLRRFAIVMGWSAKAVDQLVRRCKLEGFVIPGTEGGAPSAAADDLDQLWTDNWLDLEAPQAGTSALIHAAAFLVATQGDIQADEAPVLITAKDALSGTGRWNRRRRCLDAFLSIIDVQPGRRTPTSMVLYLPNLNVFINRDGANWKVERRQHQYGVPVEPLTYKARLGRPFGSSRISRAVMSLHDGAMRTALRSEVTAELYSVPQRVLLGADESAFVDADGNPKTSWQMLLGRIFAIGDLEDPHAPNGGRADVKEFSAASQEPHIAQLRAWAQLFAGETSIRVSSLGISTDANPASAEAWHASDADLIAEAEGTTDGWSPAWRRTMATGLQMLNGWDAGQVPADVAKLQAKWRSPAALSRAAAADSATKLLNEFPWLRDSELGLELAGFDDDFIRRAMAERRRQGGSAALQAISAAVQSGADPAQVKAKADALGALIRSGVDPQDAAAQVGLPGVRFTGAIPVSLRLPATDAATLEDA